VTFLIEFVFFIPRHILKFLFYILMHVIYFLFKFFHVASLSLEAKSKLRSELFRELCRWIRLRNVDRVLIKSHRWASKCWKDTSLDAFLHFWIILRESDLLLRKNNFVLFKLFIKRWEDLLCKLCRVVPVFTVTFGAYFVDYLFNCYILWMSGAILCCFH
jgi:hypothetical protein